MTNLRKIFSISTVALAAALTACGGGGSSTPLATASDVPATTIGTSNLNAAKAAVSTLIGAPAITLPATTASSGPAIPANTSLQFTSIPPGSSSATAAGFNMTNGSQNATGTLDVGSCIFNVTGGNLFPVGSRIVFNPCAIDLNTAGKQATGVSQSVPVTISLGTTNLQATGNVIISGTGTSVNIGSPNSSSSVGTAPAVVTTGGN